MRDATRGYLNAASGLTELTRKRAQELAQSLLSATGAGGGGAAVAHQVSALAEELVSAARSNRRAVREMIRGEVEVAVSRLGLVPASELAEARKQIAALESAVADLSRGGRTPSAPTRARTRPKRAAVKRATSGSTGAAGAASAPATAKKSAAAGPAATKPAAKKPAAKTSAAKKTAAKKTAAKKTAAKKTAAKKPAARTSAATKTAPTSAASSTSPGESSTT
jgi:polyhydroxyalkanoate synthesis regulator phasin